jgi:hypothetical protein
LNAERTSAPRQENRQWRESCPFFFNQVLELDLTRRESDWPVAFAPRALLTAGGRHWPDRNSRKESPTMRVYLTTMMLLFVAAGFLGCAKPDQSAGDGQAPSAAEVQKKIGEAAKATSEFTAEKKDEYVQMVEKKLAALDKQIDTLRAKASQQEGEIKQQAQQALDALKQKRKAAADKLKQLRSQAPDAWQDFKDGVNDALNDLQHAYNDAASHFKSSEGKSQETE